MKSKCILWTGTIDGGGYGVVHINRWKRKKAHRAVWEGSRGLIPEGLVIDHKCRVRNCINIHHMRKVTNKVNVLAGIGYTAQKSRQTHCIKGHILSKDNLVTVKRFRACLICQRQRNKLYMRRIRQLAKGLE